MGARDARAAAIMLSIIDRRTPPEFRYRRDHSVYDQHGTARCRHHAAAVERVALELLDAGGHAPVGRRLSTITSKRFDLPGMPQEIGRGLATNTSRTDHEGRPPASAASISIALDRYPYVGRTVRCRGRGSDTSRHH